MIKTIIENGENVKFICIGDVVSQQGCDYLRSNLIKLKKEYGADFVIVNGENSAVGNGITVKSAQHIFTSGADVITLGNHALRRNEIYNFLDENEFIIRPCNFHSTAPGRGSVVLERGALRAGVINLQGTAFLEPNYNPFDAVDKEIQKLNDEGVKIILVDFHAEASGEKKAMGFYLDGRVSLLYGTHTHVQTSDEQILPCGTGYITDLGMTGPYFSVLGVEPSAVIQKLRTNMPVRFTNPNGDCTVEGVFVEIDNKTAECTRIERFRI